MQTFKSIIKHGRITAVLALTLSAAGSVRADVIPPFDLASAVAIADMNNDGFPDIVITIAHIAGPPPHPGFVSVILQNPQAPGTFLRGARYSTGPDPTALAVGDLNGDGRMDVAVVNYYVGSISILMQDPLNPGMLLPQSKIHVGGVPMSIVIADIDGDDRADIAVANGSARILFQDASNAPGTFLPPVTLPLRRSIALSVGDINGDGILDLVSLGGLVTVLVQDPANRGTFFLGSEHAGGPQLGAVQIADLNADGLPDLALANSGTFGKVLVLLQETDDRGRFADPTKYASGRITFDVAVSDLNADGKADLVTVNFGSLNNFGSVSVLLQDGPRKGKLHFVRKKYLSNRGVGGVALGDLNEDGRPDIALAEGGGATAMFQQPTAPGKFFAPVSVGR